jgi:hypothetical protein
LRFASSDLIVGFRFSRGDDMSQSGTWSATNHKIGSFTTTAPFSPVDPTDSASFSDSNVIAAILGNVTLSGVDVASGNSTSFGVGFRASAGASAKGVLKIAGVLESPPFNNNKFDYLGLLG